MTGAHPMKKLNWCKFVQSLLSLLVVFADTSKTVLVSYSRLVENRLTTVQSLTGILESCGGFMPLGARILVDSIATSCLQSLVSGGQRRIAANTSVKVAFLQFGSACVSTPWPTGALSPILEELRKAASTCRIQSTEVIEEATKALRLCNSVSTPRVPALHIDMVRYDLTAEATPVSARSLVTKMQNALEEEEEELNDGEKRQAHHDDRKTKRKKVDETKSSGGNTQSSKPVSRQIPVAKKSMDETMDPPVPQEATEADDNRVVESKSPPVTQEAVRAVPTTNEDNDDKEEDDDLDLLPSIIDDGGPDEDDA